MLRFGYARLLLVCCLPLLLPAFARSDPSTAIPDGAQILKELLSRRDSVDNLAVEAVWEEFEEGKPSAWEEERVYRDNLGRIRVRYYHGTGGLGTGKKHMVDDVFDGEITANVLTDPTRNRLGELLKSGKTTDAKNCYRAAIIHDGEFPAGRGLTSHRNPFSIMDEGLIQHLPKLLEGGKPITVKPVEEQEGVYELRYHLDRQDDPETLEHRVRIDTGKGWVVTKHEEFFPNGKSARRRTCEYKQDARGVWVPTEGRLLFLWGGTVPTLDWRFTVHRVVVNNPRFDESVFDVILQPGVLVTDTRFDVTYWIGEDVVSGSDLTHLAEKARTMSSGDSGGGGLATDAEHSTWLRGIIIILAVIAIAVLIWRLRARHSVAR